MKLFDLPYELVVLMVSWLDMHDIEYRLPAVCKLFYTIANDPVTWARAVCVTCSRAELRRILRKHPSVTIVMSPTNEGPNVVTGTVIDSSWKWLPSFKHVTCGAQRFTDDDCQAHADQLLTLDIVDPDAESPSLAVLQPIDKAMRPALSPFTRLTTLGVYNAFELQLDACCPQLTSLKCRNRGLTVETWTAFVNAHPGLISLHLTLEDNMSEELPTAPMLRELRFLKMYLNGPEYGVFARFLLSLVSAADDLLLYCSPLVIGKKVIKALSSKPNLTYIKMMHVDETKITADHFLRGFKNLRLRDLEVSMAMGYEDFRLFEVHSTMSPTGGVEHPFLRDQLQYLSTLALSHMSMPVEMASTLGRSLKRLRTLFLMGTRVPRDSAMALAPALQTLQRLTAHGCSRMSDIAEVLAECEALTEIDLECKSPEHSHEFASSFFRRCAPRCFVALRITPCSALTLRELSLYFRTRYGATVRKLTVEMDPLMPHETSDIIAPDLFESAVSHCVCDPSQSTIALLPRFGMW